MSAARQPASLKLGSSVSLAPSGDCKDVSHSYAWVFCCIARGVIHYTDWPGTHSDNVIGGWVRQSSGPTKIQALPWLALCITLPFHAVWPGCSCKTVKLPHLEVSDHNPTVSTDRLAPAS